MSSRGTTRVVILVACGALTGVSVMTASAAATGKEKGSFDAVVCAA